jgi:nucleotide-binding universal stress UspA family protein
MSVRPLIIVPIDDSPETEPAVHYAAGIARARGADLHAVQVVPRRGSLWTAPRHEVQLRERIRALRPSVEKGGMVLRIVTLRGTPESAIPSYAQLKAARLIVVAGNYGSLRLWRSTNVTSRLSRLSPVPVLVVPRHVASRGPFSVNRIVAPVNFTAASAVSLRAAVHLSARHGARVTMLHAIAPPRQMVLTGSEAWRVMKHVETATPVIAERLMKQAQAFGSGDWEPLVVTGDAHHGILRAVTTTAADLVVMGVAPRTRGDEVIRGSTLRAVLRRTKVPVLVLPVVAGAEIWMGQLDADGRESRARATLGAA